MTAGPCTAPVLGADAAHDVDAHHGAGRLVDELDGRGGRALGRAGEAGAEDGVDDHVGHLREHHRRPRASAPPSSVAGRTSTPSLPRMSRLSLASPVYSSGAASMNTVTSHAGVEQLARDDEAVAAVVALAGEHHGLLGLVALEDLAGDGQAGALHEVPARDADALDGGAVDLAACRRRCTGRAAGTHPCASSLSAAATA